MCPDFERIPIFWIHNTYLKVASIATTMLKVTLASDIIHYILVISIYKIT
jgi:hypothetical protein